MKRTVILHYHLFKNAGTSLDEVLKVNFGDRWVTKEFGRSREGHTDALRDWILGSPDSVAFSTHTATGPIPEIEGIKIISVMLLRDPIARIRSVYRFERKQNATTLGATLAKKTDFSGYVKARLEIPGDRQCRNFQMERLASFVEGPDAKVDRAVAGLHKLSVAGRVERFQRLIDDLEAAVKGDFPDFKGMVVLKNTTKGRSSETPADTELDELMQEVNKGDYAVLAALDKVLK